MEEKKLIDLVAKATQKDNMAIETLYKEYYRDILFICRKYSFNDEDANDIAQDTFIKAFEQIGSLSEYKKFPAWIKRIANNKCLDVLKHNKVLDFQSIEDDDNHLEIPDKEKTPEEMAVDKETGEILSGIIAKLPVEQRVTVFLFFYQDYSVKEIATMYECSEKTVRSRLNYAKKAIMAEIEKMETGSRKNRCIALVPFLFTVFAMENEAFACEIPDFTNGISQIMASGIKGSGAEDVAVLSEASKAGGVVSTFSVGKIIGIVAGIVLAVGVTIGVIVGLSATKEKKDKDISVDADKTVTEQGEDKADNKSDDEDKTPKDDVTEEKEESKEKYLVLPKKKYYYKNVEDEEHLVSVTQWEYNENNQVIKEVETYTINGENAYEILIKYDSEGRDIEYIGKNRNGYEYRYEKEYNESGICIKYTEYTDLGTTIKEYDNNGNLMREDNSSKEVKYTYDEKNRETSHISYEKSSGEIIEATTEYDDEKKASVTTYISSEPTTLHKKTYDDKGNVLTSEEGVLVDGEYNLQLSHEFRYDDENREVYHLFRVTDNVADEEISKYNENGKLVEKIENNIRGTEVKEDARAEYEYDDNGNLIWESYKSGSWGYETTYEYDEKNGLIREIEKNKDKDEIYVYENEYILINE